MQNTHTLRVATAAVGARAAGAALKLGFTEALDAAISLAADVLFFDVENWEHAVESMPRCAEESHVGFAAEDITAKSSQPQQRGREEGQPHVVRMRCREWRKECRLLADFEKFEGAG